MKKLFLFWAFALVFFSCGQDKSPAQGQDSQTTGFNTKKFPKKTAINDKAAGLIKNWPEFNAFDASFDAVYRVANEEDLKLVIEDLIEKQKLLEASAYPELFNKPQIKSRQKVLKTFILKTKGNLEYRINNRETAIEMINAYNALRNQFNVMANNTLDTKSILLDE